MVRSDATSWLGASLGRHAHPCENARPNLGESGQERIRLIHVAADSEGANPLVRKTPVQRQTCRCDGAIESDVMEASVMFTKHRP